MRLIDADALFVNDVQGRQFVSKTAIDAAPTVSCAKCIYQEERHEQTWQLDEVAIELCEGCRYTGGVCVNCYCADHFERKET